MAPELRALDIADDPDAWAAAGFSVTDGAAVIDGVALRFTPVDGAEGITGWSLTEAEAGSIDGLFTTEGPADAETPSAAHANGTIAIDHVVAASPDLPRTVAALESFGIEARRTRDTDLYGGPMRQVFFRLGRPILELIGPPEPMDGRPTVFWGLALTVDDLDATKQLLGDGLGDPKDAVQPGRRIATLRHRDLGISVPVAFMSPEP
ncbi:MAG: glyoxalase [Actinomycetota bacterium]